MKVSQSSTAIILFARTARLETIQKQLISHRGKNRQLHEKLISAAKKCGSNTFADFFHFHEDLQTGSTFGERISNCAKEVFAKGYEQIVIVGGDCVELTETDILEATLGLKDRELILGPDCHGGAYLIGISNRVFSVESFQRLKWNSEELFDDLKDYAHRREARVLQLAKKITLNSVADIVRFAADRKLRQLLIDLFTSLGEIFASWVFMFWPENALDDIGKRGPPAVCFRYAPI